MADVLRTLILPGAAALSVVAIVLWRNKGTRAGAIPAVHTAIPWFGVDNALAWYRNPTQFMEEARKRYGPLYTFELFGTKIAIVMHPYSLRQLERQTKDLSDHLPLEMAAKAASGMEDCTRIVDVMLGKLTPLTGQTLTVVALKESDLRPAFHRELRVELARLVASQPHSSVFRLKDLVCAAMYRATSSVLFGPTYPFESYGDFCTSVASIPFLAGGLSRLPFSRAGRARTRLLDGLVAYVGPWWESDGEVRMEGVSDLVVDALVAMKGCGLSVRESAAAILGFMWGVHNNIWFHMYWLMAQILVDEGTREAVEAEVRATADTGEMRLLESAMYEALRWPFTVSQVRRAAADIDLRMGDKRFLIEKDTWILPKALNHDDTVYADPFEFKPGRFLDPLLPKPKTFGDGQHMCKGMHYATFQMLDFASTCFQEFDIRLVRRNGEPRTIPQAKSNLFLADANNCQEYFIELKSRSDKKLS